MVRIMTGGKMHEMWKKTKGKCTGGQIMGGTKRETERLRKYGCIFNIHGRITAKSNHLLHHGAVNCIPTRDSPYEEDFLFQYPTLAVASSLLRTWYSRPVPHVARLALTQIGGSQL